MKSPTLYELSNAITIKMKMRNTILSKLLLIPLFLLISCADDNDISKELAGSSWTLAYFLDKEDGTKVQYTEEKKMGLSFDSSDELSVIGYCNTGEGNYHAENASIAISDIRMTYIGCPGEMNDIEHMYVSSIQQAESYERTADTLKIFTTGLYDLVFYKAE